MRHQRRLWGVLGSIAVLWVIAASASAAVSGSARVESLLGQMTLGEKISLIHGAVEDPATFQGQAGYIPGIPRLGIPSLRLADGPPGVLTRQVSTAPTSTMGLAATFSRADAEQNGVLIGRDARALGIDVVLQPFINIHRDQAWLRSYNTYGEDPLLTGQIGAAVIKGIQRQGVMAQAKHYVAYEDADSVVVDPQALREIYVAPFADAVDAGVASIMCAYSKLNGVFSCGNDEALNVILRGELGFKGFVASDWGATHGAEFINRGLDLEMPGDTAAPSGGGMNSYFSAHELALPVSSVAPPGGPVDGDTAQMHKNLGEALKAGTVSEATITAAARRILVQMDRFGLLDKDKHDVTPEPVEDDAKIVEKTAEDAAILLKNDEDALPLKSEDLSSLVLIGPGAGLTMAVGISGEKALGRPERQVGTVEALKHALAGRPDVQIGFETADDFVGVPLPAETLSHDGKPGLLRTDTVAGATQIDPVLNFTAKSGAALPVGSSHRWTGTLKIPANGHYQINLQIIGATGSVTLDGKELGHTGELFQHGDILQAGQDDILPTPDRLDNVWMTSDLTAGDHPITVTETGDDAGKPVQIRLNWVTPERRKAAYAAAIAAAKAAKTVVVFVWSQGQPPFVLPGEQDKLIDDITAVNSNVIVVLNTSEPVAMPWLDKVNAVLDMGFPGDEGGWATANILLGKVSPAGRLPVTWPQSLDQNVANDPTHPARSAAGMDGKTDYSEGIFVGYRWFDRQKLEPLFPFGHGLSYAKFSYTELALGHTLDGGLDVTFKLKNIGAMRADEVPQIYIGAPNTLPQGGQIAVRALAAFDRISLAPGESRTLTYHLTPRRFQYWSASKGRWDKVPGARIIYVGASSRDLPLQGPSQWF